MHEQPHQDGSVRHASPRTYPGLAMLGQFHRHQCDGPTRIVPVKVTEISGMAQRRRLVAVACVLSAWASCWPSSALAIDSIVYTVRIPEPSMQYADIEARVPTDRRASIELMMPIWSPGYYRIEDYAANVEDLRARTTDGVSLAVDKTAKNRWRIETRGAPTVVLSYRVRCAQRSVTTNWIGPDYAVLNGAPTFITLVERTRRPHEIQIELPSGWTHAMTALPEVSSKRNRYRAADYEELVDSPMLAGKLAAHAFDVAGKQHFVVAAGDYASWDGARAARDLAAIVAEAERFWGVLPYDRYLFLLMFRQGGGGLEHRSSNLTTVQTNVSKDTGQWSGIGILSHEYFHLFNVKRLRPIELSTFDFEKPPTTGSLWISEGLTSYYGNLLMARSGLQTPDQYLASLSSLIGALQKSPGRLLQSVEQSSREVWGNSNSGVNPNANTVSYYNKGAILGLLLDAKIRRATGGRRSLDDVMRQAYKRYSDDRGFTPLEFQRVAEDVARTSLADWFRRYVSSTDELDYSEFLDWYGLQFISSAGAEWALERRPDATPAQRAHLQQWVMRYR